MTNKNKLTTVAAALVIALGMVQSASALPIADKYIGANDHGYGDVVGSASTFGIDSMDVSLAGSTLFVSINTAFAGRGDDGLFAWATDTPASGKKGIGYGDLFLSSAWTPFGTAADGYINDDASNGTVWSYGFSLDDRWMSESAAGTGSLYSLNSGDNSDILVSDDFLSAATYRNGQEVAVDLLGDVTSVGSGSWNVDSASQLINFEIDLSGTSLLAGPEIALHWGMSCGNDVIEGAASVPEPGVLGLLGFGGLMLSLAGFGRKRRN